MINYRITLLLFYVFISMQLLNAGGNLKYFDGKYIFKQF